MRVLLTGAAGSIGRVLTVGLADRGHEVVGLDLVPQPDGIDGAWHTADCADPDAVADVFAAEFAESSLDAVVHLAGHPGEASLPDSLDLARRHHRGAAGRDGRARRTPASSTAAPTTRSATRRAPGCPTGCSRSRPGRGPDTFYGVAKVGGRGADEPLRRPARPRRRVAAGSARSGPSRTTVRHLATWLSHDDCVRMVEAALTTPAPGLRGALRHLAQHPRLVGPRPRPGAGLRPAGRRRGLGGPDRGRPDDAAENARGRRRVRAGRRWSGPPSTAPEPVLTWSALQP